MIDIAIYMVIHLQQNQRDWQSSYPKRLGQLKIWHCLLHLKQGPPTLPTLRKVQSTNP